MRQRYVQSPLPFEDSSRLAQFKSGSAITNDQNRVDPHDRPIHDWYRFVLSFPPHLVRDYIDDFGLDQKSAILDPFCGTGTTVIEAKFARRTAIGVEANPFAHFASSVKVDWDINPEELHDAAKLIASNTYEVLDAQGIDDRSLRCVDDAQLRSLGSDKVRALIKNSISPLPLHKTLVLLEQINRLQPFDGRKYCILALGSALVNSIGNLRFGPEVGVGKIKSDVPVVASWVQEIRKIVTDLSGVYGQTYPPAKVYLGDARDLSQLLPPNSIDAVITSPPYPNEKDYTRTTRLESVILGFVEDMVQLRKFKKTLLRSNTRGVYAVDNDDLWVADHQEIQDLAQKIEARRIELGKTSGFEKMYARVTKLYFGGMARHLADLRKILRPNAQLAYVVGDQASYLQVMIRTGQLLAKSAERLGYKVERIDLFRTRYATATQSDLREEVVVLRWPG